MRIEGRFSRVVFRSIDLALSAAELSAEVVTERIWPATEQFVGWTARGVSQAAMSTASTAWSVIGTVATKILPTVVRFVGQIAGEAYTAFDSVVSQSAKSMRSTARLATMVVVVWFFPFWLMLGLMGNAFFAPHNLVPMLSIAGLITVLFIWISRRKQRAQ